jgi:hypothetical protein
MIKEWSGLGFTRTAQGRRWAARDATPTRRSPNHMRMIRAVATEGGDQRDRLQHVAM